MLCQRLHGMSRQMTRADFSSSRATRWRVALAVALLHVALVLALVRAFAPEFTSRVTDQVFGTVTVIVTTPPPVPPPPPTQVQVAPDSRAADLQGAAAAAGKQAVARPVAAPRPRIVLAVQPAPPVAGQGSDNSAGARDAGAGTGAGGQGTGTGSGTSGTGQGGGGNGGGKLVKIAGEINSARDYPRATREQRLGDSVVVALTVGTDGRVKSCRVHRASKDPAADQITCRLATDRFRFRPATDSAGNPVEAVFGWQQRWFDPKAPD